MQVLVPPQPTQSYQTEEGHFIKTFLISTKPNQAGWQIDKATAHEKVKSFKGKPFVIIPESINDPNARQKGHIFANTKDELLLEYTKHTHGIIDKISDPIPYHDGTDDYYYTANIKLLGSKAASALIEHGEKSWIPFAVSPHVWGEFDNNGLSKDWEGVALSLVPSGAYGIDAVVNKYCKGEEQVCTASLAASVCSKEDDKAAAFINSSLLSQNENNNILSTVQIHDVSETKQPIQKEEVVATPVQDSKNEELESLKKQVAEAQKDKEEKEQLKAQLQTLVNENKTTKLNKIFESVKDESVKKTLFDKYFNADVNQLNEFAADLHSHVFPSLVEQAKAQAESELKNKTIEENKNKSKAGSLPKEPKVEESKAASIVPNRVNEVKRFDRLMRGFV